MITVAGWLGEKQTLKRAAGVRYLSNPRHLGTWTSRYWLGHLGTRSWTFRYWPGHLGTGYWTVRDLDETIFLTDHNCLVLINCQYFCTSTVVLYRPAVENQKIKCNEPMGYTPISYVIGKRNDGTLRIMMP